MTRRREQILKMLRDSESALSIRDIARRLDVHPNTVRFHLQVLVDSGRVERGEALRAVPGRPPSMFQARRGMDPAGPRNYLLLADAFAARMSSDPAAAERSIAAGQLSGSRIVAAAPGKAAENDDEATETLVGILNELGFSPERRPSPEENGIGLRNCPFLDLIQEHASVICQVHLGLMQGVMTTLGAGVTVDRLEPFVEPDLCLAHLGPVGVAS